jgi:hypothetical protein
VGWVAIVAGAAVFVAALMAPLDDTALLMVFAIVVRGVACPSTLTPDPCLPHHPGMDRRRFLLTSLAGALATPLAAKAQPAGKVYRIGLFHVGLDHVPPAVDGLRAGLNALGYNVGTAAVPKVSTVIEGPNIRLDWRNLADEDAALETAKSFVRDRVDVIVACENQAVRAAQAATSAIPVVFVHVTDPVAEGFVKTLSRPGANLTGMSDYSCRTTMESYSPSACSSSQS